MIMAWCGFATFIPALAQSPDTPGSVIGGGRPAGNRRLNDVPAREYVPPPVRRQPNVPFTLTFDVDLSKPVSVMKGFKSVCGRLDPFPGVLNGLVGWGQAEIGWLGENCMAFVLQLAVTFDSSQMDSVEPKTVVRAVLTYDETRGPNCPLVQGYEYTCWQNGDKAPEDKPNGCVEVRVPVVNWFDAPPNGWDVKGLVPVAAGSPRVTRISARVWDVTEPFRWQSMLGAAPLNSTPGYGFLLTGGPSIDQLTAQDNTICVSALSNIKLHVTYTVPPEEAFRNPR